MDVISAIIVDDEPLAREGLCVRMQDAKDFRILAKCGDGQQAIRAIREHRPDVVFMDIEMPGLSGLELVTSLQAEQATMPEVVFVTAFDNFALQAFEQQAFDYLLKPVSDERLEACLQKIRQARRANRALDERQQLDSLLGRKTGKSLDGFLQTLEQSTQPGMQELQQTLSIKCGSEWIRTALADILWIEAAGDYLCIYTQSGNHIARKTLKQMESELDARQFLRVNRATIVNLSHISRLTPNSNGEYLAQLASGQQIKVSRRYKFRLDELKSSR